MNRLRFAGTILTAFAAGYLLALPIPPRRLPAPAPSSVAPPPVAHFAPGPGCRDEAVRIIDRAERTVRLSAYGLSEPRILDALARAKGRGVEVDVLVDRTNEGHAAIAELADLGVDVRFDEHEPIAHAKSIVADGRVVLAGSANWTPSSMKDLDVCITIVEAGLAASLDLDFAKHRMHAVADR